MRYVVILRATSAVTLGLDNFINVPINGQHGIANVRLSTLYRDYGVEHPLPDHLVAVVEGENADLTAGILEASTLTNNVLPLIAFAGNGKVEEARYQFAYDASAAVPRRRFTQFLTPGVESARAANHIPLDVTGNVLESFNASPHRGELYTAVTQYGLALREWVPGYQMAAVSHLFMGMEALKSVAVEAELAYQGGITRADLARQWNVTTNVLDNEARLRLLFQGDAAVHNDAREASNAYEHGDPDFAPINERAGRSRDVTLRYLREALARMLDVTAQTRVRLTTPPLTIPPLPGGMEAITGDLPADFTFEQGAAINFMPFLFEQKPSRVELDAATGNYNVEMSVDSRCQYREANVDGTLYTSGTNLVSRPAVAGVIRQAPPHL